MRVVDEVLRIRCRSVSQLLMMGSGMRDESTRQRNHMRC